METNYVSRDTYGMYRNSTSGGPGPALMGADTLLGNDVYNLSEENLGTIKEFMIDMASGRIGYAVVDHGFETQPHVGQRRAEFVRCLRDKGVSR